MNLTIAEVQELIAHFSGPTDRQQQIAQALVDLEDYSFAWLLGALRLYEYKSAWPSIIAILRKEADADRQQLICSTLLGFLKDLNRPLARIAYEALLQMGGAMINPAYDILTYCWSDNSWIQGVCAVLRESNPHHLDMLLTPLMHLLEIGTDENGLDESAMGVLSRIGSPKANAAIPLIIGILTKQRSEPTRLAAIDALGHFSPQALKPAIPALRKTLDDESQSIRDAAARVLKIVGDSLL